MVSADSSTSDRHQRLKHLFSAALDIPSMERAAFLESQTPDAELVADCLDLLDADGRVSDEFLSPPTSGSRSASSRCSAEPPLAPGDCVDGYEILEEIGRGGMGFVFRARDLTLGRDVALKAMAVTDADSSRIERFDREARSLAALNHPNVVTVHAVGSLPWALGGQGDGGGQIPYLVMELVDGQRLDEFVGPDGLAAERFRSVARQLVQGVAAAHEHGIVHRDLKPANVMLTKQGVVKVLDFGLAKEAEVESRMGSAAEVTRERTLLGTVPYMSPEQVAGHAADRRSDVFSLGAVLYRVATGSSPFFGRDDLETLQNIVRREPPALETVRPDLGAEVAGPVHRALKKRPESRYADAGEMAADFDLALVGTAASSGVRGRRWSSGALATLVVGLGLTLALLTGAFVDRSPRPSVEQIRMRPLTSTGDVIAAAISPDGQQIAYVESEGGLQRLLLREVDGGPARVLVPPTEGSFWGHVFTPNGRDIVFGLKGEQGDFEGVIYRMSLLGGTRRRIGADLDSTPMVSPDGQLVAWFRERTDAPDQLIISDAAGGGEERVVREVEAPYALGPSFFGGVAFSPDSQRIAVPLTHMEGGPGRVMLVDLEDGREVWSTDDPRWSFVGQLAWLPSNEALLLVAGDLAGPRDIWRVPLWEGEPVRVTFDLGSYRIVSLSNDGQRLVTVPSRMSSGFWFSAPEGRTVRVSAEAGAGKTGFDLLDDGRLLFAVDRRIELYDPARETSRLLVEEQGRVVMPRYTRDDGAPDGIVRYAVMPESERGELVLYSVGLDGRGRREIAALPGSVGYRGLSYGPVAAYSAGSMDGEIFRTSYSDGSSEPLTGAQGHLPAVSPRGDRLAFYRNSGDETEIVVRGLDAVGRIDPQVPPVVLRERALTYSRSLLRWSAAQDALFINTQLGDRSNLWRVPLDGGSVERVTQFDDDLLLWWDRNSQGAVAYSRGNNLRDAVLIEGVR